MLLVVSPNLAVDRILELEQLRVGEVQRSHTLMTQPGGKGSNVSRVFRQLGGNVTLLGFAGRWNSAWIREPLLSIGVHVEAIDGYDNETRVCTTILETGSPRHPTVINEESRPIEPRAVEALEARFDQLLDTARMVLVTGSLSKGLPADFYAGLIRKAADKAIPTAIDATGSVMRHGLNDKPAMAKANQNEMTTVLGSLG